MTIGWKVRGSCWWCVRTGSSWIRHEDGGWIGGGSVGCEGWCEVGLVDRVVIRSVGGTCGLRKEAGVWGAEIGEGQGGLLRIVGDEKLMGGFDGGVGCVVVVGGEGGEW